MITAALRRPRGQVTLLLRPQILHVALIGLDVFLVQCEEKRLFCAMLRLSIRMACGWTPFAGETRPCSLESSNLRDPFAVNVRTRTRT